MKWFYRFLALFIAVMTLYTVFSRGGVYDLWRAKKDIAGMTAKNSALTMERNDLAKQIDLLQNDTYYIEKIAREELGMARKNEVVVYLKKESNQNAAKSPKVK